MRFQTVSTPTGSANIDPPPTDGAQNHDTLSPRTMNEQDPLGASSRISLPPDPPNPSSIVTDNSDRKRKNKMNETHPRQEEKKPARRHPKAKELTTAK